MATARHRRRWASTARLWPRGSSSAARSTQREQISALGVADVSFRMQLSMEETTPASPSTGMGSSARSCARSRLPSSGDHGRSDFQCSVFYHTSHTRKQTKSFAPTRRRLPTRSAATIAPQAPYHPPQNIPPPDARCHAHRLPLRLASQHTPSPHNSRLSQPRGESRVAPGPARPQQPRGESHVAPAALHRPASRRAVTSTPALRW